MAGRGRETRTSRSLSLIIPAYNEEAGIRAAVREADEALERLTATCEVLVVDDGSTDATAEVAASAAWGRPNVRVLRHSTNRGYGAALRTGFEGATGEAVWLLDSDGQFDPADLPLLVDLWEPGSLVAGYRARRSDPWPRRVNHAAFFTLVRALAGPTLRDVNCAFKLFDRELGVGLSSTGAMISTELALRARARGWRIVEVAVPHHPRTTGSQTGARPAVVARAFVELLGMRADRADATGAAVRRRR